MARLDSSGIKIFGTCPQSRGVDGQAYLRQVSQVARWSEDAGYEGVLVYTDNSLVDPWLVSQLIVQSTQSLSPLVAVQPAYMHPYSAAKMVASLGHLHGRRLYLNIVAGGFKNDLELLGDPTEHDERYARAVEYALIMRDLLDGAAAVTRPGTYYTVRQLRMTPPVAGELAPGFMISGSSSAGMAAAEQIGATAIKYPQPPGEEHGPSADASVDVGVRVGVIARDSADEAWAVAHERFPEDRKGQLTHKMAMKVSDSEWHKQLSGAAGEAAEASPYWLGPFQNYKTFCPYLVGSYSTVGDLLAGYIGVGYRTFILDIPASEDEIAHTQTAFEYAVASTARAAE